MTKNIFGKWGLWVLILLTIFLISAKFEDFSRYANSRVIEPWGDGYKSYVTLLYHIQFDQTYSHFEGMNYPYGEHVVPADTQPLLSNAFRFINRNLFDITPYAIGIFNCFLLLGILLCAVFLYLIFRKLKLPDWYSILIAIGLTFLAPQLARIGFHYGLGHPEVLVLVLYLLLRFDEKMHWKWSIYMALVVWVYSLIHFYYFAIMAFTIGGFFFFRYLQKRVWARLPVYALHFSIQLLVPLIFFVFWMYYNDPVQDRTDAPWGFFIYRAFPAGIFYNPELPHFRWFSDHLIYLRRVGVESQAYIGLVSLVVIPVIVLPWVRHLFRKPAVQLPLEKVDYLNNIFYTGLAIMLFAFGLPFILPGFDALLDFAGPIRQFRSIGRFAWVFYYTMGIVAFTWLFHWASGDERWKKVLLALALMVLSLEAFWNVQSKNFDLDAIEEFTPGKGFTEITDINYQEFQAILPIPYYNIGSDNFWWHLSGFIGQKSETLSLQTGLPTTGAMLTRTSLGQTLNQIQLVTEPYRLPRILSDFPNQKPLLMVWDEDRAGENRNYEPLREGLAPIFQKDNLLFYNLPLRHFTDRIAARKEEIKQQVDAGDLYEKDGFLQSDSLNQSLYFSFDDQVSDKPYMGQGGFQATVQQERIIYEGAFPQADTNCFQISTWMFLEQDLYPRTEFILEEYQDESGEVVQQKKWQCWELLAAFDNNGWGLLEMAYCQQQPGSSIRIAIQNKALKDNALWLDELLIRPVTTHLYKKTDQYLFNDNRWFSR
ncbi:MAG: hypothetical protein DHS20C18_08770 [Saprospiraceae bacterium]|nr:MAG: hypothetical protein DHS20C18_08770 [Saprospiraceae bacterium]